jgi:hypothetical protein
MLSVDTASASANAITIVFMILCLSFVCLRFQPPWLKPRVIRLAQAVVVKDVFVLHTQTSLNTIKPG